MEIFLLVAGFLSLGAAWVGHAERRGGRGWLNPLLLVMIGAAMVSAGLGAMGMHDPEVTDARYAAGLAWAVGGLGLVPVLVFYAAGYLIGRTWILAVVWGIALVPFAIYVFFLVIVVADYVNCPIDAHECPL